MDEVCLTQLDDLSIDEYGKGCVPNEPLTLIDVHLISTSFNEHSLVAPKFHIEKNKCHSIMPPFHCHPCTYGPVGHLGLALIPFHWVVIDSIMGAYTTRPGEGACF